MSAVDGTEMVGSSRLEPGGDVSCTVSDGIASTVGSVGAAATASTGPYTEAELTALFASVWSLDADGTDLTRFDELLFHAVVFIGTRAMAPYGSGLAYDHDAAALLRSMARRVALGPDHPVRQP